MAFFFVYMSEDFTLLGNIFLDNLDEDSTIPVDTDRRFLRSGSSHLRLPLADTSDTATKMPDQPDPPPQQLPQTMKVLPQTYNIPKYTGSDPSHTALDFMTQCEDAFSSVMAISGTEKINFVKQQLAPNSRAFKMMSTLDFKKVRDEGTYESFKKLFFNTFGEDRLENVVKVLSASAEYVLKGQASHTLFDAQVPASKLTEDALRILKTEEWSDGESITFAKLTPFLYLSYFMLFLDTGTRVASLSVKYSPTETVSGFCDKVKLKLAERTGTAGAVAGLSAVRRAPAAAAPASATLRPQSVASHSQASTGAIPKLCTHCQKSGHLVKSCFIRKNELRKAKRSTAAAAPSPTPTNTQPSARAATLYCEVHGQASHTTADCRSIQRLKTGIQNKGSKNETTASAAATPT